MKSLSIKIDEKETNNFKIVDVSVIIPFYLNKNWLKIAIESVFNQDHKNFEIIVINDGSPENILDLEEEYPSIRFVKIKNSGPGKARNIGISLALGRYIAFLDADDIWISNKLSAQINFMNQNNFMWIHSNYIKFSDDGKIRNQKINCKMVDIIVPKMFLSCPIATPCVMIRRSILKDNLQLRFSEIKRVGEDSHLWFKIGELYPLGFVENYLTYVRIRGDNAAIQAYVQLKSRAENYELISKSSKFFKYLWYFKLVKFGYLMCWYGFNILNYLTIKIKFKYISRETLAKIIYSFPYVYIKTVNFIGKKK